MAGTEAVLAESSKSSEPPILPWDQILKKTTELCQTKGKHVFWHSRQHYPRCNSHSVLRSLSAASSPATPPHVYNTYLFIFIFPQNSKPTEMEELTFSPVPLPSSSTAAGRRQSFRIDSRILLETNVKSIF